MQGCCAVGDMAAPVVLNGVNKTPYVLLERLGDDVRPSRDHTQRIPLSDRNPVVLLQRLPLGSSEENGEEGGENGRREVTPPPVPSTSQAGGQDSPRDGHKRSLTPPPMTPCSATSTGTPTKRVRFNSTGSEGLSARRQLWTRLQRESVTSILKAKSSATKENLSVLLGVKSSRGVPIVSLERLKLGAEDTPAGASATHSPTSSYDEDADVEEEPSSSKSGEALGPGRRAAASCSYQQMDSSDDNWLFTRN